MVAKYIRGAAYGAQYRGEMGALTLDDGRLVELGERTHGGSKNETRYGRVDDQAVVVKIQRTHGRLDDERRALEYLATAAVRVPRVIGMGATGEGERFLVISREPGSHAETPDGWARFGRDLAAVADISICGCPLPRVPISDFVAEHRGRLDEVRPLLAEALAHEIAAAIATVASERRLVVTHGDPGTGNYLDSGDDDQPGVLIDWETATVAPFGLDLGRAAFIGMLDLRHTGIPEQLSPALIGGYLERSKAAGRMSDGLLNAWTTIAGLQFIHGRHRQLLVPERTPQAAAEVLSAYLAAQR